MNGVDFLLCLYGLRFAFDGGAIDGTKCKCDTRRALLFDVAHSVWRSLALSGTRVQWQHFAGNNDKKKAAANKKLICFLKGKPSRLCEKLRVNKNCKKHFFAFLFFFCCHQETMIERREPRRKAIGLQMRGKFKSFIILSHSRLNRHSFVFLSTLTREIIFQF